MKLTSSKTISPSIDWQGNRTSGVDVFGWLEQQFVRTLKPRNRLAQLGADAGYLCQRHDQEAEEQGIGKQPAHGQTNRPGSAALRSSIMSAPTNPKEIDETRPITDVTVKVCNALSSRRRTPSENTAPSRDSAW